MKILGIDPGYCLTGLGIIECIDYKIISYHTKQIKMTKYIHHDRLTFLAQNLLEFMEIHNPNQASVEQVFFAKNYSSTIKLGKVLGVVCYVVGSKIPIQEYATRYVKYKITGKGNATKVDVKEYMSLLCNNALNEINYDESDALAVAVTSAKEQNYLK
jgi:crossover junction endodeoxyribonuclease RuvC